MTTLCTACPDAGAEQGDTQKTDANDPEGLDSTAKTRPSLHHPNHVQIKLKT